jgi:DNA-binding HxlR family transcriptional regulator
MGDNLAQALGLLGDRWTLQVIASMLDGPKRFGQLSGSLDGIAPNVLTARLRQLERDGLIVATPYSQRPARLAYSLTDAGRELSDAIALLTAWGARQSGGTEGPLHDACGTPLETRLYCPTCDHAVEAGAAEPLRWL